MARARRSKGFENLVIDDLRMARDVVGIDFANAYGLRATLDYTRPKMPGATDEQLLAAARASLREHLEAYVPADTTTDKRDLLALHSLRELLLRNSGDDRSKALIIRREALNSHPDIHLSEDGLRKREDRLLPSIATFVEQQLIEDTEPITPVRLLRESQDFMVRDVALLRDKIRRDDGLHPNELTDQEVLRLTGLVTVWAFRINGFIDVIAGRKRPLTRLDMWIVHMWFTILGRPITTIEDQVTLARIWDAGEDRSYEAFSEAALAYDPDLIGRWRGALRSCHESCSYGRSRETYSMCRVHHLIFGLETLVEACEAIAAKKATRSLNSLYGRPDDYFHESQDAL